MTLAGGTEEWLSWQPAVRTLGRLLEPSPLTVSGRVLVPAERGEVRALYEGNRSVVVPGHEVSLGGRTLHLSVKGCGAAASMYGQEPFRVGARGGRRITRESWMGEAPFGGQGETGAMAALALSRLAPSGELRGMHVCPTLEVSEVPERFVDPTLAYRRHVGPVVQELRLVPSDVRLFGASERTLGRHPDEVLHAFGVVGVEALEAFFERFVRSAIALLTMYARTLRAGDQGEIGLDLDDVWLDKDALLAPDGTLFFVDLEALEWVPAWPSVEARVRRQIGRNAYEVLYAIDVLLETRERWRDRPTSAAARRSTLAALLVMALEGDPFVRAVPSRAGLDLVVVAQGREIPVPFLDEIEGDVALRASEGEARCE